MSSAPHVFTQHHGTIPLKPFHRFPPGIPKPSSLFTRRYRNPSFSIPILTTKHQPLPRIRLLSTQPCPDSFYKYTNGRWLWDEDQNLRDRFTQFNIPELKKAAARSIGAGQCVEMTKLAEGSFNKTFKLTMDNGESGIARIPHPIAGPRYYTTASEVATMDFVYLPLSSLYLLVYSNVSRHVLFWGSRLRGCLPGVLMGITPSGLNTLSWRKRRGRR